MPPALYNLDPLLLLAALGMLLGGIPLAWWWWRHRDATPARRLRALTWLALFLTLDLIVLGAFTRLSDSGLGCPDWPGCYGQASPLGAHDAIQAAQQALPSGPVTHAKAWVEMLHRYLATTLGVLIIGLAVASWQAARRGVAAISPRWAGASLIWVCVQGGFGALTVTWKLYPAIVTAHLLGALGLMVLLALQAQAYVRAPLRVSRAVHGLLWAALGLSLLQITLGAWVSTNYAVLACSDFPTCQGQWWPAMDFKQGFGVFRPLGLARDGGFLPFAALTAIHLTHRLGAIAVVSVLALLGWRLAASADLAQRRCAVWLAGALSWQLASGLGNALLGWPMAVALAHTAGAAVLITLLAVMLARAGQARSGS